MPCYPTTKRTLSLAPIVWRCDKDHACHAEYDAALEEMVCHDEEFRLCQRREMCALVAEQMQEDFFAPTLTQIANNLWQAVLPRMTAATTKAAKKRYCTQKQDIFNYIALSTISAFI